MSKAKWSAIKLQDNKQLSSHFKINLLCTIFLKFTSTRWFSVPPDTRSYPTASKLCKYCDQKLTHATKSSSGLLLWESNVRLCYRIRKFYYKEYLSKLGAIAKNLLLVCLVFWCHDLETYKETFYALTPYKGKPVNIGNKHRRWTTYLFQCNS